MSDQNYQDDDAGLQAPARLVEALRRLDTPTVLVPPQIDDAALSRPRLHLARIRQRKIQPEDHTGVEEVALAARTEENRIPGFGAQERLGPIPRERKQRSKVMLCAIVVLLAAAALLLWAYWKHTPR